MFCDSTREDLPTNIANGEILDFILANQIFGTVEHGLLAFGGEVDGDGDVASGEPFAFHRDRDFAKASRAAFLEFVGAADFAFGCPPCSGSSTILTKPIDEIILIDQGSDG